MDKSYQVVILTSTFLQPISIFYATTSCVLTSSIDCGSFELNIFRRKFFFERKKFNSKVFFLLLKLPMMRRVQVCRVSVLYNTSVKCLRGSEAVVFGFECHYLPFLLRLLRSSFTRFYFLTTKVRVFSPKILGHLIFAFYLKINFFSGVTETNDSFSNFFQKFATQTSIILEEPNKKFISYKSVKSLLKINYKIN